MYSCVKSSFVIKLWSNKMYYVEKLLKYPICLYKVQIMIETGTGFESKNEINEELNLRETHTQFTQKINHGQQGQ